MAAAGMAVPLLTEIQGAHWPLAPAQGAGGVREVLHRRDVTVPPAPR
jgi:hypothetical protein